MRPVAVTTHAPPRSPPHRHEGAHPAMTAARRVVVTGLGATTPVGGTVPETWDAILAGRSGARTMPYDWVEKYELPVKFAATIHTPPEEVLTKVEVRRLDPSAQYALIAAREAWADAGAPEVDPERLAACIGTGIGGVWTLLSTSGTTCGEGPAPGLPARRPDAHAQRLLGRRLARDRRPRRRPHARLRLRLRARGDGLRRRDDPQRPRRHRRRRWHRGRRPRAAHRRVRRHAGPVDPQRRPRARLAPLRHRPRRLRPR